MTENKRDVPACTEIGEPAPGTDAFHTDDDVVAVRSDCREEGLGLCTQVAAMD